MLKKAFSLAPFGRYYFNTIFIVILIFAVQLVTITIGTFAFVNYKFVGHRVVLFFILL